MSTKSFVIDQLTRNLAAAVLLTQAALFCALASADPVTPAPEPVKLPEGVSSTWWQDVQKQIAESEYEVSWVDNATISAAAPAPPQAAGKTSAKAATASAPATETVDLGSLYQAPNRKHNLRTYFTGAGPLITPRTDDVPQFQLGLELSGVGDPKIAFNAKARTKDQTKHGLKRVPKSAKPTTEKNELRYEHGGITEWYVNSEGGLKQNFTIDQPQSDSGTLALDIEVTGDLLPFAVQNGTEVEFRNADGVSNLQYTNLYVHDSKEKALQAHFEVEEGSATIRILVDDKDAVYPVTVDPLVSTTYWSITSPRALTNYFGSGIANNGDLNNDGYDDFVIGEVGYGTVRGRVWVYLGGPQGLSTTPQETIDGEFDNDSFGQAVDISGDVDGDGYNDLLVGAYGFKYSAATKGRIYVFFGSAKGINKTRVWSSSTQLSSGQLGTAVAFGDLDADGKDDVIAGAANYNGGVADEGGIFVWYATGITAGSSTNFNWSLRSRDASARMGDFQTITVGDINGDNRDDLIVGAPGQINTSVPGEVYGFFGGPGGLATGTTPATNEPSIKPDWIATGTQAAGNFGYSLACADFNGDGIDDVAVGSPGYQGDSTKDGAVFIFNGVATTGPADVPPNALPTRLAVGGTSNANMGYRLTAADVNGDGFADLGISTWLYQGAYAQEGRLQVHLGTSGGLQTTPFWTRYGLAPSAEAGYSLSSGDVNGDGFADIAMIVFGQKRAEVWYGSAAGAGYRADWFSQGGEAAQAGALFGTSVASGGDFNGDGYDDVLISAVNYDNGSTRGAVYAFNGSPSGLSQSYSAVLRSDQSTGDKSVNFGFEIAFAGNVDGDAAGCDDILIGAPSYDLGAGGTEGGRAWLYRGSPGGLITASPWIIDSNVGANEGQAVGYALAGLGHVNNDAYDDIAVSAPGSDAGGVQDGGVVMVFLGSATGFKATVGGPALTTVTEANAHWRVVSNQDTAGVGPVEFGTEIAHVGDVDGNGYEDLLMGAAYFDNPAGGRDTGAAFLFLANSNGTGFISFGQDAHAYEIAAWKVVGAAALHYLGDKGMVAGVGDVDGRGKPDWLVGQPDATGLPPSNQLHEGRVQLFYGEDSFSTTPAWQWESDKAESKISNIVAAGDLNKDGFKDFIVHSERYPGTSNDGRATIFLGGPNGPSRSALNLDGDVGAGDRFAGSDRVASGDINGDGYPDIVIGANNYDGTTTLDSGAAFVYYGPFAGPTATPQWSQTGTADQGFGHSVANAGDVNGDGYDDVVIGAHLFDISGAADAGRAFLYLGGANGLSTTPSWTYDGELGGAEFGTAVMGGGDLNHDGNADVLVSALNFNNQPGASAGQVLAFYGQDSAQGLPSTPSKTLNGTGGGGILGYSLSMGGDVNGDGIDDALIGEPFSASNTGRVYVYYGQDSVGLGDFASWVLYGLSNGEQFGLSCDIAPDINGDGYDDILVGAPTHDTYLGIARGYYGGAGDITGHDFYFQSSLSPVNAGSSVAGLGDINGDGYGDFAIGVQNYDTALNDVGRVYIWLGRPSLFSGSLPGDYNTITGTQESEHLGARIRRIGDVNADGYGDMLVSAYLYDKPDVNEGDVRLWYGGPSIISGSGNELGAAAWHAEGNADNMQYGGASMGALGGGGDVNGDRVPDFIVGNNASGTAAGRVDVFYGGPPYPSAKVMRYNKALDGPATDFGRVVRARLDYSDGAHTGGPSKDSLSVFRYAPAPIPANWNAPVLPVHWLWESDRTGFTNATLTLEYTNLELRNVDESQLTVYKFPSKGSTSWSRCTVATRTPDDLAHNRIVITGLNASDLGYFAISTKDSTPPEVGTVTTVPTSYTTDRTKIVMSWSGFSEPQSAIAKYQVALGSAGNATQYLGWTDVGVVATYTFIAANIPAIGGSNFAFDTFLCSVRAVNTENLASAAAEVSTAVTQESTLDFGTKLTPPDGADLSQTSVVPSTAVAYIKSANSEIIVSGGLTVNVELPESSQDFDVTDVTTTNANVSGFSGFGKSYSFVLTPTAPSFSAKVAVGRLTDAAGNSNVESNVLAGSYDSSVPGVTLSSVSANPVNGPIVVTATLTQSSTNFDATDIDVSNAAVSGFTGSGTSYSFTLTPSGAGSFSALIKSKKFTSASKDNAASNVLTRVFDNEGPGIVLGKTAGTTVNGGISVTATLSEPSVNFVSTDLTLTNATVSSFAGSGANYSFVLTPTAAGSFDAQVNASAFTDAAGNSSSASTGSISSTFGTTTPGITLTTSDADPVKKEITVSATLTQASTNFASGDITTTNATVSGFSKISSTSYSFKLSANAQGSFGAIVNASTFTNGSSVSNAASNYLARVYDNSSPTVALSAINGAGSFFTAQVGPFTVNWKVGASTVPEPFVCSAKGIHTPMRVYHTQRSDGGVLPSPVVDLSRADYTTIHYNSSIPKDEERGLPNDSSDDFRYLYVDSSTRQLKARQPDSLSPPGTTNSGLVLLSYEQGQADGSRSFVGAQVVEVRPYAPDSSVIADIGDRLVPTTAAALASAFQAKPFVARGGTGNSPTDFIYQHGVVGSDVEGAVYAIRRTVSTANRDAEVFWMRESDAAIDPDGPDVKPIPDPWNSKLRDLGIIWPVEMERFQFGWPDATLETAKYQKYVRDTWVDDSSHLREGEKPGAGVRFDGALNPSIMPYLEDLPPYKITSQPSTGTLVTAYDHSLVSAANADPNRGWFLMRYRPDDEVSFVVVHCVDRLTEGANVSDALHVPADIGAEILDTGHVPTDTPGYIHVRQIGDKSDTRYQEDREDKYDWEIYDANNGTSVELLDNVTGQIIPVNLGKLEVWWYKKDAVGTAWPSFVKRYKMRWPGGNTPPSFEIAAETGTGVVPTGAQLYYQNEKSKPGFNPNDEHALLLPPQGENAGRFSAFALRNDLGKPDDPATSEPWVLVKSYSGGKWTYLVRKVKTGTLTYPAIAGAYLNPPYPLSRYETFNYVGEQPAVPDLYTAGTVSLTNGSAVLTGAGTSWTSDMAGKSLSVRGTNYTVQSVSSSTSLTLTTSYVGSTVSGQKYQITVGEKTAKVKGSYGVSGYPWEDRTFRHWVTAASKGRKPAPNQSDENFVPTVMRYYYPVSPDYGFYLPTGVTLTPEGRLPWLGLTEPIDVTYNVAWPAVPKMKRGDILVKAKNSAGKQDEVRNPLISSTVSTVGGRNTSGLPAVDGQVSAEIIFDETKELNAAKRAAKIIDFKVPRKVVLTTLPSTILTEQQGPDYYFSKLRPGLKERVSWNPVDKKLMFQGIYVDPAIGDYYVLLNVMTAQDVIDIKALCGGGDLQKPVWDAAVNDLAAQSAAVTEVFNSSADFDRLALTTGDSDIADSDGGYITVAMQNATEADGLPVSLEVIKVAPEYNPGEVVSVEPTNPFDERMVVMHKGDYEGKPDLYTFQWWSTPDTTGSFPVDSSGNKIYPPEDNQPENSTVWSIPTGLSASRAGVTGQQQLKLEGANAFTLKDNWFIVRYKPVGGSTWSGWAEADLAQGWIKRVVGRINPYTQRAEGGGIEGAENRFSSFGDREVNNIVSMISQAGPRYTGNVPLNVVTIDDLGLIEIYESVLNRGKQLSIDAVPALEDAEVNTALLLAAGRIADLYSLLGNEAYADASDPTIGFGTEDGQYGNEASSIFCFQNQVPTLLAEELGLLRGRDDTMSPSVTREPIYNKLVWNFTNDLNGGEVAYALNYNIQDQTGITPGTIDEEDAKKLYPQGHGDAWGHYLSATKAYYKLLKNKNYTWVPRAEGVKVGGATVTVDYLDERKFARAAEAKARAGAEIVGLTYRDNYIEDVKTQWQGYTDDRDDLAVYRTGTVTVTQNSKTVTGVGTVWVPSMTGQILVVNGISSTIANVLSGTSITLASAYTGTSGAGQSYAITLAESDTVGTIYSDGTITLTNGSKTVTGVGTTWTSAYNGKAIRTSYSSGTIAVTNGTKNVSGTGTDWSSAYVGKTIRILSTDYVIAAVNSSSSLTLATNYSGTTSAAQSYNILGTSDYLIDKVNSATSLTLTLTYDGSTSAAQSYSILASTHSKRRWGVADWASRAGQGAYFDWLVANAILPTESIGTGTVYSDGTVNVTNGSTTVIGTGTTWDSSFAGLYIQIAGLDYLISSVSAADSLSLSAPYTGTTATLQNYSIHGTTSTSATNSGVQKIDRKTVLSVGQIADAYDQIQGQMDQADIGLSPLGLANDAIPFGIAPDGIASGKTHFEQVYDRAVTAMNNALTVFDHANNSSQLLRRQNDKIADFQRSIQDQEADFNNRLIEVFGYPYDDDIGGGGTYPEGYDGPDLYHYMLVNRSELTGEPPAASEALRKLPVTYTNVDVDTAGALTESELTVDYYYSTLGFGLVVPPEWTGRRAAPGEIQQAQSELLQTSGRFKRAIQDYSNLVDQIDRQADLLQLQYSVNRNELSILNETNQKQIALNDKILAIRGFQASLRTAAQIATLVGDASAEFLPKVIGFANDATSSLRGALKALAAVATELDAISANALGLQELEFSQTKEEVSALSNIRITSNRNDYAIAQSIAQLTQLVRSEISSRLDLYGQQEALQQASGRYQAALKKGERLLADRLRYRQETAAQVQGYRYKDMAFRVFRNDALQKYRAQFDLAARYVYLAAKAYDYETVLLDSDSKAGSGFLSDIVRARSIGLIQNGQPVTGGDNPTLADAMGRMWLNFNLVLRPQLSFNNPQTETNRFSLRSEAFRILPGSTGDANWRSQLAKYVVDNIFDVPEVKRFCLPPSPLAATEPGLVIPFSTNVNFGLNYFGWPLGGGDSAYDSSNFATKIRSVGVWFSNYNNLGSGMSNTPRVYLIPVGSDILRTPSSGTTTTREFRVVDQVLPTPFPIGPTDIGDNNWIPTIDTQSGPFEAIRQYPSFRAYHDSGTMNPAELATDSRLVGRSVWNTRWLLVIPAGTLGSDRNEALARFIYGQLNGGSRDNQGVSDIKLFFQTYAYSGNTAKKAVAGSKEAAVEGADAAPTTVDAPGGLVPFTTVEAQETVPAK